MKRSGPLKRHTPLRRGKAPRKGIAEQEKIPVKARSLAVLRRKKKLPKKNLAAARRKLARYSAFIASAAWRTIRAAALERAGYRCERVVLGVRCPMTDTLTVHHLSYMRFGGRELPKDLQVLCKDDHDAVEAMKPGVRLWQKVAS